MDKSYLQGGTGLLFAAVADAAEAATSFMKAMARHRHFGREMDPPLM